MQKMNNDLGLGEWVKLLVSRPGNQGVLRGLMLQIAEVRRGEEWLLVRLPTPQFVWELAEEKFMKLTFLTPPSCNCCQRT